MFSVHGLVLNIPKTRSIESTYYLKPYRFAIQFNSSLFLQRNVQQINQFERPVF